MTADEQSRVDEFYRLAVTEAHGMYVFSSPQTKTELRLPKEDLLMLRSAVESMSRFSVDYPPGESAAMITCNSTGTSIKVPFQELACFIGVARDLLVTGEVEDGGRDGEPLNPAIP